MRSSVYPVFTKFELMNIVVVVILFHLINSKYRIVDSNPPIESQYLFVKMNYFCFQEFELL